MIKLIDLLENIQQNTIFPFQEYDKSYDENDNSLLSVDYIFNTPKNKYKVIFYSGEYSPEDKTFDLSFGINTGELNKLNTFQMTGEGNVRAILKTVAAIIEDFLNTYSKEANTIIIDATDEKRRRVYKTLFPKYLSSNVLSKVIIK